MRVKVEQKHIDMGQHGNPRECPIALAIREITEFPRVGVGGWYAWGSDDYTATTCWSMPAEARAFIRAFDKGLPVKPVEFEFEEML